MSDYTYTVDSIGDDALTDSILMRTVTEVIDEHIITLPSYAFYGCSSLKTVVGEKVTKIEANCFSLCTALETVSFPQLVSLSCSFEGFSMLKNVNLPAVKSIGIQYAFRKCTALEKIDLPSCTYIGVGKGYYSGTFAYCSSLETAIFRSATMCTLGDDSVFAATPIAQGTGYIYVPQALIESYRAHESWSKYVNQFRVIEDYPDICGT